MTKLKVLAVMAMVGLGLSTASAQIFSVTADSTTGYGFGSVPLNGDELYGPIAIPYAGFGPPLVQPATIALGAGTGLNVDAFSFGYDATLSNVNDPREIYFSVNRDSTGLNPPPSQGVRQEATLNFGTGLPGGTSRDRGQAGDIFRSLSPMGSSNADGINVVYIDDNGFRDDFNFLSGAGTPNTNAVVQNMSLGLIGGGSGGLNSMDSSDVTAFVMNGTFGSAGINSTIFYSLDAASAATEGVSEADVLVAGQVAGFSTLGTVYASEAALGLVAGDDIAGLTILENPLGDLNVFEPLLGDRVVFSLTRGSPSLGTIAGANMSSAHIFVSDGTASLLVDGATLGIGTLSDSVNGFDIDFNVVPEPSTFAFMMIGLAVFSGMIRKRSRS